MRVAMLTREYPPEVYGGAGVHVDFLVRELRHLVTVDVHCFGRERPGARAYQPDPRLADSNATLQTISVDVAMAAAALDADVVHSHTWYANLGGLLASALSGAPHVLTAHSLEPRRPWKAEQLGGGYAISRWAEATAYQTAAGVIAVSDGMRADVLAVYPDVDPARVHVVRNGIDARLYAFDPGTDVLEACGVDTDRPYVIFVGRLTRQKGVDHLLAAARAFDPGVGVVLCAGAPDTPAIREATQRAVADLAATRGGVVWVEKLLERREVVQLLSHALAFLCPSIYEPLGIVNLEAMACGTAVVASAVGGIPEVVADQVTGLLVAYDPDRPELFEAGLAAAVNTLAADPDRARAMGRAGRDRAVTEFSWPAVARDTVAVYRSVLGGGR